MSQACCSHFIQLFCFICSFLFYLSLAILPKNDLLYSVVCVCWRKECAHDSELSWGSEDITYLGAGVRASYSSLNVVLGKLVSSERALNPLKHWAISSVLTDMFFTVLLIHIHKMAAIYYIVTESHRWSKSKIQNTPGLRVWLIQDCLPSVGKALCSIPTSHNYQIQTYP